jgi:hypothetical protein
VRRRDPGTVREQVAQRDRRLPVRGELGQVLGGRIVEGDQPALDQLPDRHRHQRLHRREPQHDRVGAERPQRQLARDLAAAAHAQLRAGVQSLGHAALEQRARALEP